MEKYTYTGKNIDELKANAYQELNLEENECLIKVTAEKGSLFKGQSYTLDVYKITDVAREIKNYLNELLTKMGLETTFETKIRGEQIINGTVFGQSLFHAKTIDFYIKRMYNLT